MPKFRKKPVVIEAVRLSFATCVGNKALPEWADGKVEPAIFERLMPDGSATRVNSTSSAELPAFVRIRTLEGVMIGQEGDWLIKGVSDEVYPCKPDIFEATYEPAEDA